MLELRFIRENLELVKEKTAARGLDRALLDNFSSLDRQRRDILQELESGRNRRKSESQEIGTLKKAGREEEAAAKMAATKELGQRLKELEEQLAEIDQRLEEIVMGVPNLCDDSVPLGNDETDNVEYRRWGSPPEFAFSPKAHWELGEEDGSLDFGRAAKLSGARFALLRGFAARLERALISFMLDLHTQRHGYTEVLPPFLVNTASMTATGQLPKFAEDLFKIADSDLWLIPTAEVPVTNIHREETIAEQELPIRYCAYTPCFRSEAGSYGRDTKGLIRQHQFDKVELVKFTTPESSEEELEMLLSNAETVLQLLELPYRVVTLCSGDLGFSARKTYDIEVWMPAQNCYREISSCSNFGDFQARRGGIRYRPKDRNKSTLVHTLNGSGLAVGRTLAAIYENHQQPDGTIRLPEAIRPYFDPRM
ncbi:serine--tRNA ligase [Desulfurivibrio alkaliphilus]|uniref:Serine--tRNA ligase n=1 Tax=Desulfurivibrio alkaliphilus (strain DSM 19089 / UNIQEM U267 / AHT2) TaxID=589865 RepID=D6Z522_DESAT|nr:serine--tRNA ligase [Desulfurivibrio alkaliphilus]ADH86647.1 seryl-tRNA synthetase [Desulfurivibrio alkaliphilus AHT 2]